MLAQTINPFTLPYVDLDDKTELPAKPGLYFVVDGLLLLYIGKSKNMKSRWASHHRYKQVKAISSNPQIAFLDVEDEELLSAERVLIDRFNPPLNDTRIDAVQSMDDLRALIQEVHVSNQQQERERYKAPNWTIPNTVSKAIKLRPSGENIKKYVSDAISTLKEFECEALGLIDTISDTNIDDVDKAIEAAKKLDTLVGRKHHHFFFNFKEGAYEAWLYKHLVNYYRAKDISQNNCDTNHDTI